MSSCFSLRRKEINNGVCLRYLKKEYPFLFSLEFLLKESKLLTLTNFKNVFLINATQMAHNFLKIIQERKYSEEIADILLRLKSIPSELRRPNDEVVACLLILPYMFSASSRFVYRLYGESTSIPDFFQEGSIYPDVVVIGDPFRSPRIYVVAEGEIMILCSEFIEAIIACMAIYCCCNIKYPDEANDAYLFIQTQFLNLKHHGKLPRRIITLAEKVKKGVI